MNNIQFFTFFQGIILVYDITNESSFENIYKWHGFAKSVSMRLLSTYLLYKCMNTGELGYDGPLYDGSLHMTDDMLGPSPMHIKY